MPDQKIARLKSGDETPVEEWIDGIKVIFTLQTLVTQTD